MHEYFLIVIKRLKEYINFETPIAQIPSFRLPLMTLDKEIEMTGTLFLQQSQIQTVLKTLEEFTHINLRWNGLAEEASELRAKQWEASESNSGSVRNQRETALNPFVRNFQQNKHNTDIAAKVIYNLTVDSLKIVEDELRRLDRNITFAEGYGCFLNTKFHIE